MGRKCDNCGYELKESAKFCPSCGKKIEVKEAVVEKMRRTEKRKISTKKETKNITLKIIAGVVAIVIVGAGAYTGYSYSKLKRNVMSTSITKNEESKKIESVELTENSIEKNENSDLLSEEKIQTIREELNIPDTNKITCEIGEPYDWGVEHSTQLVDVKFKKGKKDVAGASVEMKTGKVMKDILTYNPQNSKEEKNIFKDIPDYEKPLKYQIEAYNQNNVDLFYKSMDLEKGQYPEFDEYIEENIKDVTGIVYEICDVNDYNPKSDIQPDMEELAKEYINKIEEEKILYINYDYTKVDGNTYHTSTTVKVMKIENQWYTDGNIDLL